MDWLRKFMSGRYGVDQLSIAILALYVVLALIGSFIRIPYWFFITLALLLLCYYRVFSRNIYRRSAENAKFLRYWNPIRRFFVTQKKKWKERKAYKFFKCPNCKQELRIPKGKGEVTITCPKCRTKFDKRT